MQKKKKELNKKELSEKKILLFLAAEEKII